MEVIYLLLLLGAAVCFGLGAFAAVRSRVNFVALGLLLWVLVPLLSTLVGLEV